MTIDHDDLAEALYSATGSGRASSDALDGSRTPGSAEVARFRCSLVTFLEVLPSDLTVGELLELLEHSRAEGGGRT